MKKFLKILLCVVLAIIVIALSYAAYVLIAYHRLGSSVLAAEGSVEENSESKDSYTIVSYNIGFGAYESDFGFFMDGGDRAWAWSKERLDKNLTAIAGFLKEQDADLYLIQEVDIGSTRSYGFDERDYLTAKLGGYAYTFAQNYDSPFLFYPVFQPHGRSRSGLMTFSRYAVTASERVELPVETGLVKLLDLDRCYSKNRVSLPDGNELVLYNLHLSAYTSDGTIATEQLKILLADMEKEYENGSYCVAGGDFNKDLLGNSSEYFGKADKEYTWAQPIPEDTFTGYHSAIVAPFDESAPVPSCRNADSAYHEGQFVLTVDGFLVTDNVSVISADVIDTGFAYSDHNPVTMSFTLGK